MGNEIKKKKNRKLGTGLIIAGVIAAGALVALLFLEEVRTLTLKWCAIIIPLYLIALGILIMADYNLNSRNKWAVGSNPPRGTMLKELRGEYRTMAKFVLLSCLVFASICLCWAADIIGGLMMVDYRFSPDYMYLFLAAMMGIVFIVAGMRYFATAHSDEKIQELFDYTDRNLLRDMEMARVEDFYYSTEFMPYANVKLDRDFFMYLNMKKLGYCEASNLLWIYMKHKVVGDVDNYMLVVNCKDGKRYDIQVDKEEYLQKLQDCFGTKMPYLAYGDTEFLAKEYKSNRQSMIEEIERREAEFKSGRMNG